MMTECGLNNCSNRCPNLVKGKCTMTVKSDQEKKDLAIANRRFKTMGGDTEKSYWNNYFCTRETYQL